jgi:hypothetical protein
VGWTIIYFQKEKGFIKLAYNLKIKHTSMVDISKTYAYFIVENPK